MLKDTIAAIATSSKDGSISIIRISGEQAYSIVSDIFTTISGKKKDFSKVETHTIHYGYIRDEKNEPIDEVLVNIMKAPRSYTMENVAEIQCHGGFLICKLILQRLIEAGCRVAEPGEFTKRAFLNGRIDLSQAESVMDIISSKSKASLANSFMQLKGNLKEKITELRNILLENVAFLEAGLDDPEHISLDEFADTLQPKVSFLIEEIDKLLNGFENGRIIKEGVKTAIVGKPNVGKSSFLNCILRDERAIVTDIPGTTRDTLEEELRIGNSIFTLIDTAGIRETKDEVEKIGVSKAKNAVKDADFVICLVDASKRLDEKDIEILKGLENKNGVILLNKCDLELITKKEDIEKYSVKKILCVSSKNGEGVSAVEKFLEDAFMDGKISYNDEIYITNVRHKENLIGAKESLRQLQNTIEAGMPEDLYTIDLVNAYEYLGKIIGETIEDDVVDKIFKDFCMGK